VQKATLSSQSHYIIIIIRFALTIFLHSGHGYILFEEITLSVLQQKM